MLRDTLYWLAKHKWIEILIECCGDFPPNQSRSEHRLLLDGLEIIKAFEDIGSVFWSELQLLDIELVHKWFTTCVRHELKLY